MAEALDATFFAFRKREKSGVLTGASIGFAIGLVILLAAFGAVLWTTLGPLFAELISATGKGGLSTSMQPLGILWVAPVEFLFLFCVFLLMAAYEAACHRWMIRGESGGGFFGLNLSADTWRVYATYWVWLGLAVAFCLGCVIVFVGLGAALFSGESGGGPQGLLMVVLGFAVVLALIYFGVRLAPAAATSVGVGRFSFFKAWTVTRDRFWAIFGAFVLLFVIRIVVGIILSTLAFTFLFAGVFANLDMTTAATDPDAFTQAYFAGIMQLFASPASLAMFVAYQIVAWVIGIVLYVLFLGVNSRAVQAALAEGKIERAA